MIHKQKVRQKNHALTVAKRAFIYYLEDNEEFWEYDLDKEYLKFFNVVSQKTEQDISLELKSIKPKTKKLYIEWSQ